MFDKHSNIGFLFGQMPKLLLIASNTVKSDSDLLVKLAQKVKQDSNITHDRQIFRNFRSGKVGYEEVNRFMDVENLGLKLLDVNEFDERAFGAWFAVKSMIDGFKQSSLGTWDTLSQYWLFIDAHCECEYQYLRYIAEIKHSKVVQQNQVVLNYMKAWLQVNSFDINEPNNADIASYLIKLTMYWAAVIELMLELEFAPELAPAILRKILPEIKRDHSNLTLSSDVFLRKFKNIWAKDKYQRTSIKWVDLFKDILVKQLTDPDLNPNYKLTSELELIDPDITTIKKMFRRWRTGETLFSEPSFRKYIFILTHPYKQSEYDISVLVYILINLFTLVQKELVKEKVDLKLIESVFAEYPSYKSLVSSRYQRFCSEGKLTP